ncbi:unnamed protein product [Peronospora belbahrii]|uniref:Uncharacterized protein n=1 Tax=Peronospora belbahrii TaxID=622444 RepID=A0AAU9L133_9STRA|nr:unnamed protein product [Peronospora belbahrii]
MENAFLRSERVKNPPKAHMSTKPRKMFVRRKKHAKDRLGLWKPCREKYCPKKPERSGCNVHLTPPRTTQTKDNETETAWTTTTQEFNVGSAKRGSNERCGSHRHDW